MPFLAPLAGAIAGAAGTAAGTVGSAIGGAAGAVGGALGTAAGTIGEVVGPALTAAGETIGQAPSWLVEQAGGLGQGVASSPLEMTSGVEGMFAETPSLSGGFGNVMPEAPSMLSGTPEMSAAMTGKPATPATPGPTAIADPSVFARPELAQVAQPVAQPLPPSQFGGAPMYKSYGGSGSPYHEMLDAAGANVPDFGRMYGGYVDGTFGYGALKPDASPGAPGGTVGPFSTWNTGQFLEDFIGGEGLTGALENQGPVQDWLAEHPNWQKGLDLYQKYSPLMNAMQSGGFGDDAYQQPMQPAPPPVASPAAGPLAIPIEFYMR